MLESAVDVLAQLTDRAVEEVWEATEPSARCELTISLRRLRHRSGTPFDAASVAAQLQSLPGVAQCQPRKSLLELQLETPPLLVAGGLPSPELTGPTCLLLSDLRFEGLRALLLSSALLRLFARERGFLLTAAAVDPAGLLAAWDEEGLWQQREPSSVGLLVFCKQSTAAPQAAKHLKVGPVVARGQPADLLAAATEHALTGIVSRRPRQAAQALARAALALRLLRYQPSRPAELPRLDDGRTDLESLLSYEGDGAAFLLCQRARCRLLQRRLPSAELQPASLTLLGDDDEALLRAIWRHREVYLPCARRRLSPAFVADGLLQLARAFARCDTRSRLFDSPAGCEALGALARECLQCFDEGLAILGLEALDLL